MTTRASNLTIARYANGSAAVATVGHGLWGTNPGPVMLLASAFLCLITFTDTLRGKIPNLVTFSLLAGGIGYHLHQAGLAGLQFALLGGLAGFLLLFLPYLLLGMGGGDVKALAALGALLGPAAILQVFILTALSGGLLALLYLGLAGRLLEKLRAGLAALKIMAYCNSLSTEGLVDGPETRIRFPYAPAITFGYFAFVRWGGIV